jgi:IS5 family transposase
LLGIDLGHEAAPDAATSFLNFRHLLEAYQLTDQSFYTINAHLAEKGLFLWEGTVVDVTLITTAPLTKNKTASGIARCSRPRKIEVCWQ